MPRITIINKRHDLQTEQKKKTFIARAQSLAIQKSVTRADGKVASARTQDAAKQVVKQICHCLYDLGYFLDRLDSLKENHIKALIQYWHKNGIANKTMQQYISTLRRITEWIGKPSIMASHYAAQHYLPEIDKKQLTVKTVAEKSKSWSEAGIDVIAKIKEADQIDQRFGAMLRLGLFFGLRRKEQLLINLSKVRHGFEKNKTQILPIRGNIAKTGRARNIEIIHPMQMSAIRHGLKTFGQSEAMWKGLNYKQAYRRYGYYMELLGINLKESDCVGHGLRAEFSENMALLFNFVPPTLGGEIGKKNNQDSKDTRLRVSENLGHSRLSVTGAYYGSLLPQHAPRVNVENRGKTASEILRTSRTYLEQRTDSEKETKLHENPKPVLSYVCKLAAQKIGHLGFNTN